MQNTTTTLNRLMLMCALLVLSQACTVQTTNTNTNVNSTPSASPSPVVSPVETTTKAQLTLPILDALLREDSFVNQLKSKLQLTDTHVEQLKQAAADELARLRAENAEDQDGNATDARERAHERIVSIIGESKANELASLAYDFWAKGGAEGDKTNGTEMALTPNAVPTDTRVVVNIPAFRMDLFRNGSLVKSYKIGIGYPQFPLPQGLRKAQTIIFNPSWTPPDSPWVAKMNVTPGEKIEPGSKLNPLGPIKIPIGLPSLIHGGKSPAKLGQFASHGCVGLTSVQVKDFAKLLAEASGTQISERDMAANLQDKTKTKTVKLAQTVPVELRYETIVVEDGKLHIYKDVYDQGTNTEENLRKVLEANGTRFEDLSPEERAQVLTALNAMSAHPQKTVEPSPESGNSNKSKVDKKKSAQDPKKQKEIVLEVAVLNGKGYPAPVDFDTGTAKPRS